MLETIHVGKWTIESNHSAAKMYALENQVVLLSKQDLSCLAKITLEDEKVNVDLTHVNVNIPVSGNVVQFL